MRYRRGARSTSGLRVLTRREALMVLGGSPFLFGSGAPALAGAIPRIHFSLQSLPFRLETDETLATPHAPATMAGGGAGFFFQQNRDPDLFFSVDSHITHILQK